MNLYDRRFYFSIIIGSIILFLGFSSNPPDGNTGAPFDGLCNSCHGGGSYNGTVDLSGFPSSITPNTTYPITLTINASSGSPVVGGFQLVTVDASNVNSGDLVAGSGSGTTMSNGREYLDHRGSKAFSGNLVSWNFNWTSPGAPGGTVITMYFSAILANGNGGTSGDKIIKASKSGTLSGGIPLSINITAKKNVICFGGSDGTATASAGGGIPPYTYLWSNGKTGAMVSMLTATNYKVTVTDAVSATSSTSVTITQPGILISQLNVLRNVSCHDGKDGSVLATALGGTSPYSFIYSSGSPNNLPAGNYSVTVTDANSCTGISTTKVSEPDTFSINVILKNPTCPLDSNGQIKINVSGATPPYKYLWTTNDTTNQILDKKVANYKVTITDSKNCTIIKTYQLISGDTIAPNLIAKGSKVYLDATGKAAPIINDFIVLNSDNCDTMPLLSINVDTFRCNRIGKGNYIISSKDISGNESHDTIEIEVLDTLKPSITCPVDITINCEADITPTSTGIPNTFDNCTILITNIWFSDFKFKGSCNENFYLIRTWMAFDSFGNSNKCIQKISIQDTTRPIIICPLNVTVNCEASYSPANTGIANAYDNCTNIVSNISYRDKRNNTNCNDNLTYNRLWIASDSCGNSTNCEQIITIQDTTRPVITCPENVTINCQSDNSPTKTRKATATDNCTDVVTNIRYNDLRTNGNCPDNYTITRLWTAFDSCGNSKSCIQIIGVQDTTRPYVFCPENLTLNCEESNLPIRTGNATAIDNCTDRVSNFSYADEIIYGSASNYYTIIRKWTAVDSCLNQNTCTQTITALDTLKLDTFLITNSSNANDGKVEVSIPGADSIALYDADNNQFINQTGLNLAPGNYIVRAFKGQCVFVFGPFKVLLINTASDLEEFNLEAYPIPFVDKIIVVTNLKSELRYKLLNTQGDLIKNGVFKMNMSIDASNLNAGIYFLKCYGSNKSSSIRLIKI